MITDRKLVEVPGHSWITGAKAPAIDGWEHRWTNHYGNERTVFVYAPVAVVRDPDSWAAVAKAGR